MGRAYRKLGKRGGKTPLGRPRRRWEDNIKISLIEIRLESVYWTYRAQGRENWRAVLSTVIEFFVS